MRTESTHRVNRSPDRNLFTKDPHRLRTVNQFPTKRALRLEAHNQNRSLRNREIVTQVMHNSPSVAHSTSRHDHARPFNIIQSSRLGRACRWASRSQAAHQVARLHHFHGFLVEQLVVSSVNLSRMNRHGTVEENRKRWQRLSLKSSGEQIEKQLRTTDSEDRN